LTENPCKDCKEGFSDKESFCICEARLAYDEAVINSLDPRRKQKNMPIHNDILKLVLTLVDDSFNSTEFKRVNDKICPLCHRSGFLIDTGTTFQKIRYFCSNCRSTFTKDQDLIPIE